jgi:hypothetical protein
LGSRKTFQEIQRRKAANGATIAGDPKGDSMVR